MMTGDKVIVTKKMEILDSQVTYTDNEKSCGAVSVIPEFEAEGTILEYKIGFFSSYWLVGLNDGRIVKVKI